MKDSILCCAFCMGLGMVVGGVVVSNNSKIRNFVTKTQNKATKVYEDIKSEIQEQKAESDNKMIKKNF